ncbi:MAG: ABC transporter ATP-binding protein/permease, partial [Hyphomicrobiales bacterium]|nr:ABC transporter ATP-binding protein/permease [Hyphomicrobiales bacterium]
MSMKALAAAVAAFAALVLAVGLAHPGASIFLLAGASATLAVTTLLGAGLSRFLKIFVVVFAVETIVFGAIFLAATLGAWPTGFTSFLPPDSEPLTTAVFGVLVYAASFFPAVGRMTRIADRYFGSRDSTVARIWPFGPFAATEGALAVAMVAFVILLNQGEVAVNVRLSFFGRDFFNALQEKNQPEFWRQLTIVFMPLVVAIVTMFVVEYVVTSVLLVRWRRWMTRDYVARWLDGGAHYRMSLAGGAQDNPDQRIAEDVNAFIKGGDAENYGVFGFTITLLAQLTNLVAQVVILWTLSANFTLPGTAVVIPGLLFWASIVYSGLGTLGMHVIGRSLASLYFAQQRFEATFRFGLARLREYSEQVALLGGEGTEERAANARFADVYRNYLQVMHKRKNLTIFLNAYANLNTYIPYVVAAPYYFLGKIKLGVLSQTAGSFGQVNSSLNFFVSNYRHLAEFRAVLDRLTTFEAAIAAAAPAKAAATAPRRVASPDGAFAAGALAWRAPTGIPIARVDGLSLARGVPTLIGGPSGVGKSTLFRALAGLWPYGEGEIAAPACPSMLLPQRPYLPQGTLADAIA